MVDMLPLMRKALATEDYRIIGEYLMRHPDDKTVLDYLRHHVPKEKQEAWDKFYTTLYRHHGTVLSEDRFVAIQRYAYLYDFDVRVPLTCGSIVLGSDHFTVYSVTYTDAWIRLHIYARGHPLMSRWGAVCQPRIHFTFQEGLERQALPLSFVGMEQHDAR